MLTTTTSTGPVKKDERKIESQKTLECPALASALSPIYYVIFRIPLSLPVRAGGRE